MRIDNGSVMDGVGVCRVVLEFVKSLFDGLCRLLFVELDVALTGTLAYDSEVSDQRGRETRSLPSISRL